MLLFIIRTEEIQRLFTIVSIHLILLFILCVLRHIAHFCWFQYISCYSLSLQCTGVGSHIISFQYISCYSLSTTMFALATETAVSIHLMLLFIRGEASGSASWTMFQYISCYSLSEPLCRGFQITRSFNTSHVTLYPYEITQAGEVASFNTSHVTLYLKPLNKSLADNPVSIHLMLLFIKNCFPTCRPLLAFQYISCYSLSNFLLTDSFIIFVSIHLMLLFIVMLSNDVLICSMFQYISCYSLSREMCDN